MNSIYQTAFTLGESGPLKTWVSAIEVAGLDALLNADDYFTVFAPTDEAFSKLPRHSVEELLLDYANLLASISHHIVPGKIMAAEMAQLNSLRTLVTDELFIEAGRELFVDDARVIRPNIECRNGVIHIIDTVLLLKKRGKVSVGKHSITARLTRAQI